YASRRMKFFYAVDEGAALCRSSEPTDVAIVRGNPSSAIVRDSVFLPGSLPRKMMLVTIDMAVLLRGRGAPRSCNLPITFASEQIPYDLDEAPELAEGWPRDD